MQSSCLIVDGLMVDGQIEGDLECKGRMMTCEFSKLGVFQEPRD